MKTGFHEIDVDIVHWTGMFDALVDFRSQEGQRGTLPPGRETGEEYSTKRKYIFYKIFTQYLWQGSQDSSGPPRVKSKLDMDDEELGVESMSHFCSPQRSFREKITDFFTSYDDANAEREGSVSPPMPILTPQV